MVGRMVAAAGEQGRDFRSFTAPELKALGCPLTPEALRQLTVEASLARRNGVGGTAPAQVREQARRVAAAVKISR